MKRYYIAAAIAWGMCIAGIAAKEKQEAADMRSVIVDIELTDQQYDALERMAKVVRQDGGIAWSTRDEISLLASGAVIDAATREIHREAIRHTMQEDVIQHNAEKFSNPGQKQPQNEQKPSKTDKNEENAARQQGKLTKSAGVYQGPSGRETWYNLPMDGVIGIMRQQGFNAEDFPYWIREDGCKMLGDYIMIAANLQTRPRGTTVETSLGIGIVCDTGSFCKNDKTAIDIAVNW